jgi:hypothetical protein
VENLIEFSSTCQFVTFQLEDMLMEGLLGFCSMSVWWSWLLNFNILTRSLYIEFVWRSICYFKTTLSTLIYKWRVLEFCSTCQFVILELLSFDLSIGNLIEFFEGHFWIFELFHSNLLMENLLEISLKEFFNLDLLNFNCEWR